MFFNFFYLTFLYYKLKKKKRNIINIYTFVIYIFVKYIFNNPFLNKYNNKITSFNCTFLL